MIRFHVDDLMLSHINPKINDEFGKWLQLKYGKHNEVKAHHGKLHDYLGMVFDFNEKGKVKIDMSEYVKNMLEDFPEKLNSSDIVAMPATDNLFNHGQGKKLDKADAEAFHMMVAKALFLCKHARQDIQPMVAVLCT